VEPPTPPPTPPSAEPRRDHSLRTGLILAAGVVVIALAILVVVVVLVLQRVGDSVGTAARDLGPDNPGAPDRLSLEEGRAFAFHDQRFEKGWKLTRAGDELVPEDLRFTSEDDSSAAAAAYVDIRLYRLEKVVGVSRCHSKDHLEPGSPNELICAGVVPDDSPVDRLEIADFSLAP
jgi:hypothetical protein